jgi:VanZ family protein
MPVLTRRRLAIGLWVLVAAAMVVLMYESVKPADPASLAAQSDKVAHALAYGLLAGIVLAAVRVSAAWPAWRVALAAFLWATAYGALAEVLQAHVGRTSDLWDGVANAAGAGLVALAFLGVRAWRVTPRRESGPSARRR